MKREEVLKIIEAEANAQGIEPALLKAICSVESSFNPWAMRFEKNYIYLYEVRDHAKKHGVTTDTESAFQKFSLGLGQVMFAVCREYGYSEPFPLLAADFKLSLHYAAKHLKKFLSRYKTLEDAISSYNQGSPRKVDGVFYKNQTYVDKVLAQLSKHRATG